MNKKECDENEQNSDPHVLAWNDVPDGIPIINGVTTFSFWIQNTGIPHLSKQQIW
jgi:hypothetical protein